MLKAVSKLTRQASAHSKTNNFKFPTSSFQASRHHTQNFKNKEKWNNIKLGIEQHKITLGYSLDFNKT